MARVSALDDALEEGYWSISVDGITLGEPSRPARLLGLNLACVSARVLAAAAGTAATRDNG